ncbi:DUF202 domain-containing protein [Gordonia sp. CPCC 206044]|uniref:DUF202 domain-containing protein n=1 Tax=Gordonia sp. CPCC 206044 TaxID=3140793 RepID=UPI003AF3912E
MSDRGLQPQRSALAWQRTAVATVVVALLIFRMSVHSWGDVGHLGVLAGFPAVLVVVAIALRRVRRLGRDGTAVAAPTRTEMAILAGAVSAIAVTASLWSV